MTFEQLKAVVNEIEKTKTDKRVQQQACLVVRCDEMTGETFDWPLTEVIYDIENQRLVLISEDLTDFFGVLPKWLSGN